MKVYILTSNSSLEERGFNGLEGVFESLKRAQKSMAEAIETDLQNHPWTGGECNGTKDIFEYDFYGMKNMFASDPDFDFDATTATLHDDEDNYVDYSIEKREVIRDY